MIRDEDLWYIEAWLRLVERAITEGEAQTDVEVLLATLRYALRRPDLTVAQIKYEQEFVHQDGSVFPGELPVWVDFLADEQEYIVFDVKWVCKPDVIGLLAMKGKFLSTQRQDKPVRTILFAVSPTEEMRQACERFHVELLKITRPLEERWELN